jgi:hypothetical protein
MHVSSRVAARQEQSGKEKMGSGYPYSFACSSCGFLAAATARRFRVEVIREKNVGKTNTFVKTGKHVAMDT